MKHAVRCIFKQVFFCLQMDYTIDYKLFYANHIC